MCVGNNGRRVWGSNSHQQSFTALQVRRLNLLAIFPPSTPRLHSHLFDKIIIMDLLSLLYISIQMIMPTPATRGLPFSNVTNLRYV